MLLHVWWTIFLAGCAGGLVGEFVTLYEQSRHDPATRKNIEHDRFYWVMSVLMALAGGGLAVLYGFKEIHVFGAMYLGASAPPCTKKRLFRIRAALDP
jgi:hypothetical protein